MKFNLFSLLTSQDRLSPLMAEPSNSHYVETKYEFLIDLITAVTLVDIVTLCDF